MSIFSGSCYSRTFSTLNIPLFLNLLPRYSVIQKGNFMAWSTNRCIINKNGSGFLQKFSTQIFERSSLNALSRATILFSLHHQVLRMHFSFVLSSVGKGEDVYTFWFSILLLNQLLSTSVSKCSKRGMDWHFCQRTIFCSVVFPRVNGKTSTTNLFNSPLGNYKLAAKPAKVVPKCSTFKLHKSKRA